MATKLVQAANFMLADTDPSYGPRNDREEMNEDWLDPVNRYAIRDIDCTIINGELEFSFRNPAPAQPLPAGGVADVINYLRTIGPQAPTTQYTPLEVGAQDQPLYIFFRLLTPINMTFSATKKGATHKNKSDKKWYGELRHINALNVSEEPLPNCRIIYFAADPISPGAPNYRHDFNFNVELEQALSADGMRRPLPLEIDPDIRYPGGSGT